MSLVSVRTVSVLPSIMRTSLPYDMSDTAGCKIQASNAQLVTIGHQCGKWDKKHKWTYTTQHNTTQGKGRRSRIPQINKGERGRIFLTDSRFFNDATQFAGPALRQAVAPCNGGGSERTSQIGVDTRYNFVRIHGRNTLALHCVHRTNAHRGTHLRRAEPRA